MNPFADKILIEMQAAGLPFDLVSECYYPHSFGNAIVILRIPPMLLKFSRDRLQEFLDIASINSPDQWHLFHDVKIAMGWATIESVVAMQDVEPLADVVRCVALNIAELRTAFAGNLNRFVRARMERAARAGMIPPFGRVH